MLSVRRRHTPSIKALLMVLEFSVICKKVQHYRFKQKKRNFGRGRGTHGAADCNSLNQTYIFLGLLWKLHNLKTRPCFKECKFQTIFLTSSIALTYKVFLSNKTRGMTEEQATGKCWSFPFQQGCSAQIQNLQVLVSNSAILNFWAFELYL